LGFGCLRFPKTLGGNDARKTETLIMQAIEGGVNYFDTAWLYPGSEELLGSILETHKVREQVFIASKLPVLLLKGPENFDRYFNQTLERLRTSYVDYYLMHMLTDTALWEKLKFWGIERWIAGKKEAGQIRRIGFSYHGSLDDFLAIVDDYPWEFCQIQYNYSDENFQAGVRGLRRAAEKMSVVIMEPLLGGRLAWGLPRQAVEIFRKVRPEWSPAAWALNWVWNQEEVGILLSGMNEERQLEENLALADRARPGMLGPQDMDAYRRVLEFLNRSCRIRCTGCNYCMPCPRGVNIPGCFSAYNTSFSIGFVAGMQQFITSTGLASERPGGPSLCVRCGKCEQHCPQHLPVVRHLAEVRKRMEPLWFRVLGCMVRAFLGKRRNALVDS
jgi:predicted aldo/keto reductase-like oxidoreductase